MSSIQERKLAATQVEVPVVNENTIGHVVYGPELLAPLATAGASRALARDNFWMQRGGRLNIGGKRVTEPIPADRLASDGWLGERYYLNVVGSGPSSNETIVYEAEPKVVSSLAGMAALTSPSRAPARYAMPLIEHLPTSTGSPVNLDPVRSSRAARELAKRANQDALEEIRHRLDVAKSEYAKSSPKDVLAFLSDDLGVGQLTTARALGVTPTAVRKWRRGEAAKPSHRGRLASFAALSSLLMEMGLHDPAGWIDIPISDRSTLTPLDLFTRGRADLAVLLGARLADPHEALDAFDASWRETYAPDQDYEVIALEDGTRSAVPTRSGHGT